jgi:hypothetical protein
MDALMGRSLSRPEVARRLAGGQLRPHEVGCGTARILPVGARRALDILRGRGGDEAVNGVELISARPAAGSGKVPFSLALVGDITLNGPLSQAGSTLSVSVRVARYGPTFSDAVTPIITLRAPARDWAQLPARTTLAVLDALSVQLNEDERIDLLRDASPLMPAASAARLAAEQRLGQAMVAGVEAQWLLEQARRTGSTATKRDLLQKSVRQGNLSLQGLRSAPPITKCAARREAG